MKKTNSLIKNVVSLGLMILMIGLSSAQENKTPVQTPTSGGGLQMLTDAIDANTFALNLTQKKIEENQGFLQEQNRQWAGVLIFGNSAFMLALYVGIIIIDRIRLRKKKKKYEEYIGELEAELKATKLGLIETLTYVNNENSENLRKVELLISKFESIDKMLSTIQPTVKVMSYNSFALGVGLSVLTYFVLHQFGGI